MSVRFPSLICVGESAEATGDKFVFDDLRLSELLPDEVTEVLRAPVGAGDISARQQIFTALAADDAGALKTALRALSSRADELCALRGALADELASGDSNELRLSALTVCLMQSFVAFVNEGASMRGLDGQFGADGSPLPPPTLLVRWRDAMTAEREREDFRSLADDVRATRPRLDELLDCRLTVRNSSRRSTSRRGSDSVTELTAEHRADNRLADSLAAVAETLDISLPASAVRQRRALPSALADSLAASRPEAAEALGAFRRRRGGRFPDELLRCRGELHFLLGIAAFRDRVTAAGIPLTYAVLSDEPRIRVRDAYDVTLLCKGETKIIPNDIDLDADHPFFFLTGANGGGKTTYLRTVGIAALLGGAGCPIPAVSAELRPPKRVFTHFPHDERFGLHGRFADEEERVGGILSAIDPLSPGDALVLLNETYSTTAEEKAVERTNSLAETLRGRGVFGVYVTHQHSVGSGNIPTLGVVVDETDENRRTFRVAPATGGGSSYARDILKKYSLDREGLKNRVPENGGRA